MKVSLEKQNSEGEVSSDLFSKFSDLPKGTEVNKKISELIKAQEKERADRLTEEIKETIQDAIERNIPAVGFIGDHYDFIDEKILDFQRLFEHLGYKLWKTISLTTADSLIYVIFDLEHFGMKDDYLRDDDKIKLQKIIHDDDQRTPVYDNPKRNKFLSF